MHTRGGAVERTTRAGRLGLFVLLVLLFQGPAFGATARAPEAESLLDTLHRKKVLTDEEYEQLKGREDRKEDKLDKVLDALSGMRIGTLSYVDYSGGRHADGEGYNRFTITRGYINVKAKLTSWLAFRITPDAHQDGEGDFQLRLKYLYAAFFPPDLAFLTNLCSEVGIGHMPWLGYEEHINPYRCQGTMFLERAGIFNSADLGVSLRGSIGGDMDAAYRNTVSRHDGGRYGSWHVGVYNGGGYHAREVNENKVPEVRISLRPLPALVPGLQAHYFGLFGKGNAEIPELGGNAPDYNVNLVMLSYQNAWATFTGQWARTEGNNEGALVDPATGKALRGEGCSFFLNAKLPVLGRRIRVFARYDRFDPDVEHQVTPGDAAYELVIAGAAWQVHRSLLLLAAYEGIFHQRNNGGLGEVPRPNARLDDAWKGQLVLQIAF